MSVASAWDDFGGWGASVGLGFILLPFVGSVHWASGSPGRDGYDDIPSTCVCVFSACLCVCVFFFFLFLAAGSLTGLELIDLARQSGHQGPGILLCLPSQHCDEK